MYTIGLRTALRSSSQAHFHAKCHNIYQAYYGWSSLRWPRPLLVWIFKYHAVWIEIAGVRSNSKKYLYQLTISKCVQNTSFSSSLWNEDIIVHLIHSNFMMKRLDGNSFCNFSRLPSWMCVRICFFFRLIFASKVVTTCCVRLKDAWRYAAWCANYIWS